MTFCLHLFLNGGALLNEEYLLHVIEEKNLEEYLLHVIEEKFFSNIYMY